MDPYGPVLDSDQYIPVSQHGLHTLDVSHLSWAEGKIHFSWLAGCSLPNAAGGCWPSLLRVHCCSWSDWCPSICVVTAVNFSSVLWIKLWPKFSVGSFKNFTNKQRYSQFKQFLLQYPWSKADSAKELHTNLYFHIPPIGFIPLYFLKYREQSSSETVLNSWYRFWLCSADLQR